MKKIMIVILALFLLTGNVLPARGDATPPISSGIVNKASQIHWGKGIQFPVLATVHIGTRLDVYEYDEDWVLVLYKTFGSYLGEFKEMSFYGYMSRDAIDCDPPLEGKKSEKADTGPGKKKGKRPKPKPIPPGEPTPEPKQATGETPLPEPTVEQMEEFDWIIRTNGLKTQKVKVMGLTVSCSFSLMAQKVGGTAPSSDPIYNHGMRVPYAATAFFMMKLDMGSALDEMALSGFASGEGGFDLNMQASGATFFIDTGAEDFTLVSFTLPVQATGTLGISIKGETGSGTVSGDTGTTTQSGASSIPVQLKKSGGGYKLVLVGLKPGGGNLEFPAVLEKTFADPDRFDKEAAKADTRRKKAEAERDRMMEEQKEKAEEETANPPDEDNPPVVPLVTEEDDNPPVVPLVTEEDNNPPVVPLVTEEDNNPPVVPLVTEEDSNPPVVPLVTEEDNNPPVVPLLPSPGDEAPPIPGGFGRLEGRIPACV